MNSVVKKELELEQLEFLPAAYTQYIKYMGSKAKILNFVISGINHVYDGGPVCDLFAGSASLSGALGGQVSVISNDIQAYSSVLAGAYLKAWKTNQTPTGEELVEKANNLVKNHARFMPKGLAYDETFDLAAFNEVEILNRALMDLDFPFHWHLFTKFYSGTWWSAYQCLWIDALREIAEEYKNTPIFYTIMASLMHAMAYSSQGTGHYAQYRDANTASSMNDILIYRKRSVADYFARKFNNAVAALPAKPSIHTHEITSMDYVERLATLPRCTIYADPPYCFVHYSRFYHAIETLVLYDFPTLQVKGGKVVKGRYRNERHQSPFSIRTQVAGAFEKLFIGTEASKSNLVLSYSNTGMIGIDELLDLAKSTFGSKYNVDIKAIDHVHMTMGRRQDRDREVEESLILARKK